MSSLLQVTALPGFEDTRPAYWQPAQVIASRPLPQDAWLLELPPLDPPSRPQGRLARWLRVAGLAAAALLALVALGLAATLLDAQMAYRGGVERAVATARA
jgi:hypothetical protein